jgi:pimeloyl-ACP methyl ester carboxylesterase
MNAQFTLRLAICGCLSVLAFPSAARAASTAAAFYQPPASVAAKPGVLLRSEIYSGAVPRGARAWRILYTTTLDDGTAALGSALVLAANGTPKGPRPAILWAHGTSGVATHCAPSLLPHPFTDGGPPALARVLAHGWIVVLPDYQGLGTGGEHRYLVGRSEARAALDAFRAAKALHGVALDNRVVVWGHSQGGHAALWTALLAPAYAPDIALAGVAAFAPSTDLPNLPADLTGSPFGRVIASYLAFGYSAAYPDVSFEAIVRPEALAVAHRMNGLCIEGSDVAKILETATRYHHDVLRAAPSGPLVKRLEENSIRQPIGVPILIAQGLKDQVVAPAAQAAFVKERCAAGQHLEFWTFAGLDHTGLVGPASKLNAGLIAWTEARFARAVPASNCSTIAQ